MAEGFLPAFARDRYGEGSFLAAFAAPVAAVHEPQEGGLDPGHAVHGNGLDKALGLERGIRDCGGVGLIDDDALAIVSGVDFVGLGHSAMGDGVRIVWVSSLGA